MLYCLKHGVFTDNNHECESKDIIPVTENMCNIADRLYALRLGLAGVTCSVTENIGYTGQLIHIIIEFKTKYNNLLFQELPNGWKWYDFPEPVRSIDRWGHYHTENGPIKSSLCYTKRIHYMDIQKAERKALRIIKELHDFLNIYDRDGLMAVMTLLDS